MSIGVVDRKLLWGRAANRCAWEDCSQRLTLDLRSPESQVLRQHGAVLGEEAHIRSRRPDGPRHDATYPEAKLDTYENLILLCPTHHTIVDKDNGSAWPTSQLDQLKVSHEARVDSAMSAANLSQRDLDELMAAQLLQWEERSGLDRWQDITGALNGVYPRIREEDSNALFGLGAWLLQRRWPSGYPQVGRAFEDFRSVLSCLLELIGQHFELRGSALELPRGHKRIGWNEGLYKELISEFNVKAHVTWLLAMELTRAANAVISAVVAEFDPLYRFSEGFVLMQDGDGFWGIRLARLEFKHNVRSIERQYSLNLLIERVSIELDGGDPRGTEELDLYDVNVVEWANAPTPLTDPADGQDQ